MFALLMLVALRHVALRSEVEAFAMQRKVTSKIEFLEAIQEIEKELKERTNGGK